MKKVLPWLFLVVVLGLFGCESELRGEVPDRSLDEAADLGLAQLPTPLIVVNEASTQPVLSVDADLPVRTSPLATSVGTIEPTGIARAPTFENISFSTTRGKDFSATFVSPEEVFLTFSYSGLAEESVFTRNWYLEGQLYRFKEEVWDSFLFHQQGTRTDISIYDREAGLPAGRYRLDLLIDGVLVGSADFTVVTQEEALLTRTPEPGRFHDIRFKALSSHSIEYFGPFERPLELFAIWWYSNMKYGDVMRRDWYRDGELFITKEEVWNFDEFGAQGELGTVAIYDYENGLAAGEYRLDLFINGALQLSEPFSITEPFTLGPLVETVSGKSAYSDTFNKLVVTNGDGSVAETTIPGRLVAIDWLPGGDHLVINSKIVVDPQAPFPFGNAYELWLWEIETGDVKQIGTRENHYGYPLVSLNGTYISVLSGSGYADACNTGASLAFISLTDLNNPVAISGYDIEFPEPFGGPVGHEFEDYSANQLAIPGHTPRWPLGKWIDTDRFQVEMQLPSCERVRYEIDLTSLTTEQIE